MKNCPNCNQELPDVALFCANCGSDLRGFSQPAMHASAPMPGAVPSYEAPQNMEWIGAPKKSPLKKVLIAIVIILVIAGLGVGGYFAYDYFFDNKKSGTPAADTTGENADANQQADNASNAVEAPVPEENTEVPEGGVEVADSVDMDSDALAVIEKYVELLEGNSELYYDLVVPTEYEVSEDRVDSAVESLKEIHTNRVNSFGSFTVKVEVASAERPSDVLMEANAKKFEEYGYELEDALLCSLDISFITEDGNEHSISGDEFMLSKVGGSWYLGTAN